MPQLWDSVDPALRNFVAERLEDYRERSEKEETLM